MMEVRKIIKLGDSTLCVSLPKFWTENQSVSKGDFIQLHPDSSGNLLLSSHQESSKRVHAIEIELKAHDTYSLKNAIIAAYTQGFTEITLTGDVLKHIKTIRDTFASVISLDAVKSTKKQIIGSVFLSEEHTSLTNTFERQRALVLTMLEHARDALSNDYSADALNTHCELQRLTHLCLRLINVQLTEYFSLRTKEYTLVQLAHMIHMTQTMNILGTTIHTLNHSIIRNNTFSKAEIAKAKKALKHMQTIINMNTQVQKQHSLQEEKQLQTHLANIAAPIAQSLHAMLHMIHTL